MEKEINTKHVKMIITVCSEDEDNDFNVEMDYCMPGDEWARLINTGEFSLYYYDVIECYKKYFERAYKKECCIAFASIKTREN